MFFDDSSAPPRLIEVNGGFIKREKTRRQEVRTGALSIEDRAILDRLAKNAQRPLLALKDAQEIGNMSISPDLLFDTRDAERILNIELKTTVAIAATKCGLRQKSAAFRILGESLKRYEARIRAQKRNQEKNRSRTFSSVRTALRLNEEDVTLSELSKATASYRAVNKMLNSAAYQAFCLCREKHFMEAAAVLNSALLKSNGPEIKTPVSDRHNLPPLEI